MTHKWNGTIAALIVLVGTLAALAPTASAQVFEITKIGKGKMVASSAQLFETAAGDIECKKASAALEFTALTFVVLDAGCSKQKTRAANSFDGIALARRRCCPAAVPPRFPRLPPTTPYQMPGFSTGISPE
jgi:hypothetical protein